MFLDYDCPHRSWNGTCNTTACSRWIQIKYGKAVENTNAIIFPQTIGNITFYNKKELIEWVENQQKNE